MAHGHGEKRDLETAGVRALDCPQQLVCPCGLDPRGAHRARPHRPARLKTRIVSAGTTPANGHAFARRTTSTCTHAPQPGHLPKHPQRLPLVPPSLPIRDGQPTGRVRRALAADRTILRHGSDSGLDTRGRASARHRLQPVARFFVGGGSRSKALAVRLPFASYAAGRCLLFASETPAGRGKPPANGWRRLSPSFAVLVGDVLL
jgi:hypothetical protein